MTLHIIQAQQLLRDAEALAAADQRQQDIEKLAAAQSTKREAQRRFNEIDVEHRRTTEAREHLTRQIDVARSQVEQSFHLRPSVADLLPFDPEVEAWRTQHNKLEADLESFVSQRAVIPFANRVEAVQLANDLQRLDFAIANMVNKLSDTASKPFSGVA